jgi:molybdate transport system substrate-binding protein
MKVLRAIAAIVGFALPLVNAYAHSAELKVFESNALKTVMDELGSQFEKATDNRLVPTVGTTAELRGKIDKGEAFDVAVFTKTALDELAKQGKVADAPLVTIARVGIGVAVRKDAVKPDVSTVQAFKSAMLNAASIGYVKQTPTAANMKVIFEKLGITNQVQPKIKLLEVVVSEAVTKGEVEIGLTQISEIVPYASVELAGPLPADIQAYTVFGGGIAFSTKYPDAATTLVQFLTSPAAVSVLRANGMESL